MESKPPVNNDRFKQADRRCSTGHPGSGDGSPTALNRLKNIERDRHCLGPLMASGADVDIGEVLDCGPVPINKMPNATYQPYRNGRNWSCAGIGSCSALEALITMRLPASGKRAAEAPVQAA